MKLYALCLNTVYYDAEIHTYAEVIGIFDSVEKARKAYKSFIDNYLDDNGVFHWDHADEWIFDIYEYEMDKIENGVHIEELARGKELD